MKPTTFVLLTLCATAVVFASGCGVSVEPLMSTPVLYTESGGDPLEHIPPGERWIPTRVYYATNRNRSSDLQKIDYGNRQTEEIRVGLALVGFGGPNMTWADLEQVSTQAERDDVVDLSIAGIVEAGRFRYDGTPKEAASPDQAAWLLDDFNDAIADARDKDVLIYVHGAKVNFYNACAFAAQLNHFMGRDMTAIAFSWPTRQDVFSYAFGSDYDRAYESAETLASLVEVLAENTNARRVHVLSWSAGARLVTQALKILRERHADEAAETLRARLRIGTVYFAAGDIPIDEFLEALPIAHSIVDRIIVTASSSDIALKSAALLMGGGRRLGQLAKEGKGLSEAQIAMIESLDRFEGIDVSRGQQDRGFDITGHNYWFEHPWASSDVVLALRTDLPPAQRGLEQSDSPVVWYMPEDYPQRIKAVRGAELRRDVD